MMPIRTLFLLLLVAAPLAVVRAADPPAPPLSPERGGVGVVMSGGQRLRKASRRAAYCPGLQRRSMRARISGICRMASS